MQNRNNVILIDAYSQIYRSFYAIRDLTNAAGEPTNALFGVANILLRVDEVFPSDYCAFVFDKGKSEHRLAIDPEYKATRPPTPDELKAQLPKIRRWVELMGWNIVESQGYEADDLIACAVKERGDHDILFVSPDKDLSQLVCNGVKQIIPRKKGVFDIFGIEEVKTKWGIGPELIQQFLALVGDKVDNIPGVPGVGPKTAVKLLLEHSSIDGIYSALPMMKEGKLKENLAASKELVKKNIRLVGLVDEVPHDWPGIEAFRRNKPNWDAIFAEAEKNGFKSMVKNLQKARSNWENPTLF